MVPLDEVVDMFERIVSMLFRTVSPKYTEFSFNSTSLLNKSTACIVLNKSLELRIYNILSNQYSIIDTNSGRFLAVNPVDNLLYYISKNNSHKQLKSFDYKTGIISINNKIKIPLDVEDLNFDIDGNICYASEGILYKSNLSDDRLAFEYLNFTDYFESFYRFTFCKCGNHIAVVSFKGKRP
jgi:hypothetical protein